MRRHHTRPSAARSSTARPSTAAGVAGVALVGCAALAGCAGVVEGPADEFRDADAPPPTVEPWEVANAHISARDVERHVRFLADDSRRGRATDGPGLERSAAWLSAMFQRAGLEPAGDAGGYLQFWAHPRAVDSAGEPLLAPNVVALQPAGDLTRAREAVVVLAHIDHHGGGEPDEDGDSIYNGADDDASGVAALVEIAQAFAGLPARTPRPVVFLAVSGTEDGRLGTRAFLERWDLADSAAAVFDLDRIGRNAPDSVAIAGSAARALAPPFQALARRHDALRLSVTVRPSDQEPGLHGDFRLFARRGAPAVALTAGPHELHHTPADEADTIDFGKIARVARLVFLAAHELASGSAAGAEASTDDSPALRP